MGTTDIDQERLQLALSAANVAQPTPAALAELRSALAAQAPAWTALSKMGMMLRNVMLKTELFDMSADLQAKFTTQMQRQAAELAMPGDGPLEGLLIDQILTCWLNLHLTQLFAGAIVQQGRTQQLDELLDRKVDLCQKRYLRAIESLARVRRLRRQTVQVNIAQPGSQVVNVAGDMSTGGH